jgi:hypothetical protein
MLGRMALQAIPVLLAALLGAAAPAAGPDEPACSDPIYRQTAARIEAVPAAAERLALWRAFLANSPDNPCADAVRRRIRALQSSMELAAEREQQAAWRQEARGGVVEPNLDIFPAHALFPDAFPVDRVRLLSEIIWVGPGWKRDYGAENIQREIERAALWTLVLRGELALVSHLGLTVDVPLLVGHPSDQGLQAALGNIALGVRGIWGTRLGPRRPWTISGGVIWGSGSSGLLSKDYKPVLDAAAVAGAHQRHLYRYDSPAYTAHLESQLGLGEHFLGLALAYHVYAGGEHVERILRYDLSWDWRLDGRWQPGVELNGGVGDGEPRVGSTENTTLWFFYLSPGLRVRLGWLEAQLALRVPLGMAWDWARLITSIDLTARL